jgi:hypothetical protein
MTAQNRRRVVPVLLAAVLAAGCGGVIDPSKNTVEEFSGTLAPLAFAIHQFTVDKNGEFEIRIVALSNADAILRVSYGPESGGCTGATYRDAYMRLNQVGFGGLISPGRYCAYLQDDLGALSQPATYRVRISHP